MATEQPDDQTLKRGDGGNADPRAARNQAETRVRGCAVDRGAIEWRAGDLRAAFRLLRKDLGFSATTILTLAVCLGANIAMFTVVYSVLLRPLPAPNAHRIVALGDVYPTVTPNDIVSNTAPAYFDRLEALSAFESQAMFTYWFDTLAIEGTARELRGMRAMLLSAVGIYGVLAFVVARRTREIGVRMALGSSARGIFRLVFTEGLVLVAAGLTLGLLGVLGVRRVLEGQVFGVTPTDPAILAAVSMGHRCRRAAGMHVASLVRIARGSADRVERAVANNDAWPG